VQPARRAARSAARPQPRAGRSSSWLRASMYRSSLRLTRWSALSMDFTCRFNSSAISW